MKKKVKTTNTPIHPMFADLTPVTCEAVTAFKVPGSLLAKSVTLKIVNGVVVEVNDLTPAENTINVVVSKAVRELWAITRKQTTKTFLGDS